jgi:hypothetical protein
VSGGRAKVRLRAGPDRPGEPARALVGETARPVLPAFR